MQDPILIRIELLGINMLRDPIINKAEEIWRQSDLVTRRGLRNGLYPYEVLLRAESEGIDTPLLEHELTLMANRMELIPM